MRHASCGQTSSTMDAIPGLQFPRRALHAFAPSRQQPKMHPGGVAASVLALLAANATWVLDCVCDDFRKNHSRTDGGRVTWWNYCQYPSRYYLYEPCESFTTPGVTRLLPPPPAAEEQEAWYAGEQECIDAMVEVRHELMGDTDREPTAGLMCRIAADCVDSCSADGLNDTEWNVAAMKANHLRHLELSQLIDDVQRITKVIVAKRVCYNQYYYNFLQQDLNKTEREAEMAAFLEHYSRHYRDSAHLLSLGVTHVSRLFIPLAFKLLGNHTNDEGFHGWIKNVKHLRDMLQTKLRGWVLDTKYLSEQAANYKMEEDKNSPGKYIIRRPVLSEALMDYQEDFLSFRDDFTALCEEKQPEALQMFNLVHTLYSVLRYQWILQVFTGFDGMNTTDEVWQLEDRSSVRLSVDADCMQLLADALEHPTCPLEDLPLETVQRREQCRQQLWDDMVQRSPHIPVTSYLAYTQRVNVNLCLLAWMAANSFSICQDVPFSTIQSVHDARCYFDSPGNKTCPISNATDAICSVSRAILLLKCRDFSFNKPLSLCGVAFHKDGSYSGPFNITWQVSYKGTVKPTQKTLSFKDSLNIATLKYKYFRIESLKPLENSFIAINLLFRVLTAGVYMHHPRLCNLPGKIFLSFQLTGIIQILSSEVIYRMTGIPDLSTAVLIDSALTLLSCIWLNLFCYQMCACIRHLRVPNNLLPAETRRVFRRQVLYALIPWSITCAACISLEKTSKYYLIHSRIILLAAISLSITFNMVCLGMVAYMYLQTRKDMQELRIYSDDKFMSKKQIVYMSVKTVILSGIGIMIRIGFQQAQDIAQFIYYLHIATMMQGPVLYIFFVCNGTTFPVLKKRVLVWWNSEITSPGQELSSTAGTNLTDVKSLTTESSL